MLILDGNNSYYSFVRGLVGVDSKSDDDLDASLLLTYPVSMYVDDNAAIDCRMRGRRGKSG